MSVTNLKCKCYTCLFPSPVLCRVLPSISFASQRSLDCEYILCYQNSPTKMNKNKKQMPFTNLELCPSFCSSLISGSSFKGCSLGPSISRTGLQWLPGLIFLETSTAVDSRLLGTGAGDLLLEGRLLAAPSIAPKAFGEATFIVL